MAKSRARNTQAQLRVVDMPKRILFALGMAMVQHRRRSLIHDQAALVSALRPLPRISGLEHIPPHVPLVLVSNHFQDANLWIGFAGCLMGYAINQVRPNLDPPVRWLVTNSFQAQLKGTEVELPFARWAFEAVAYTYGMIPHELRADRSRHAAALREILHLLGAGESNVVGFFPEGVEGTRECMRAALPGTGIFMLRLAKMGVPVVPCAVWRDAGGRMHARFGPSICFEHSSTPGKQQRDDEARRLIMQSIACLLPDELQNTYAAAIMQEHNHGQVGTR